MIDYAYCGIFRPNVKFLQICFFFVWVSWYYWQIFQKKFYVRSEDATINKTDRPENKWKIKKIITWSNFTPNFTYYFTKLQQNNSCKRSRIHLCQILSHKFLFSINFYLINFNLHFIFTFFDNKITA